MFDVMIDKLTETEISYAYSHGARIGHRLVNGDYSNTRLTLLSILISGYDIVSPDRIALCSCMCSSSWSNHLS